MPDLIIDGRAVSVAKGTMVIEAAEACGIMIPRFCWHKALGAAGACRLCAVMFLEGPVKGLEMSCMTPAADGMVVETFHPEAVAFRRRVIELLMVNHPHDCPVCDEGGQCLLQDETISGNHALRRYPGRKRTYLDQDLGPFIQHEMNRCIHCYRCARFYQEYCGYRDFGPMQNANRVYFGRFESGPLENPFAGNLADLCPTGTLTDKPSRFTARRWDCQRAPSVCLHCSLGCNTVALSRYREVVRIEARENDSVNGSFLCDRGRFAHGYATSPERLRTARLHGQSAPPEAAAAAAAKCLGAIMAVHGPASVGVIGSTRSSLETQATLAALAQAAGWRGPAFFKTRQAASDTAGALTALTPAKARSLGELAQADVIVCLGVDPLCDAPMLALSLRQATRRGATVIVADPRPVDLPLPFIHLPLHPAELPQVAGILAGDPEKTVQAIQQRLPLRPDLWPVLEQAAKTFGAAKRPAMVVSPALARTIPDDDRIGLFPILRGPNAAGAALFAGATAPGLDELAEAVGSGSIKALIVVERGLLASAPALAGALGNLETLVVLDYLPTPTAVAAGIFLPTTTLFESGGLLLNNEARLQRACPVTPPGEPVSRDGGGNHPPRAYDRPLPGTDPRPAAWYLTALAEGLSLSLPADPLATALAAIPDLAPVDLAALPAEGLRLAGQVRPGMEVLPAKVASAQVGQSLTVVSTEELFGTEIHARYAPLPRTLTAALPDIVLHPDDAAAWGLEQGDKAALHGPTRQVSAMVRLAANMARGVIVIPNRSECAELPAVIVPGGLRRA